MVVVLGVVVGLPSVIWYSLADALVALLTNEATIYGTIFDISYL